MRTPLRALLLSTLLGLIVSSPGCVWLTSHPFERVESRFVSAEAAGETEVRPVGRFLSDGVVELSVSAGIPTRRRVERTVVRSPGLGLELRSYTITSLSNVSGFGLLLVPLDAIGDWLAPPFVAIYSAIKGLATCWDETPQLVEERGTDPGQVSEVRLASGTVELRLEGPGPWTLRLDELVSAGLDPSSVEVILADGSRAGVLLPTLPDEAPAWFRQLQKDARPRLPLPSGLRFGADAGEYAYADGSTLVFVGDRETGFFMGKHELTWGQFRAWARGAERDLPPTDWTLTTPREKVSFRLGDRDDEPVSAVTWQEAQDYCQSFGLRLPSRHEWQRAAGADSGQLYPWGDDEPNGQGNFGRSGDDTTDAADGHRFCSPVGAYARDRSPWGCMDMAGNVLEWTTDFDPDEQDMKLMCGSSFDEPPDRARVNLAFRVKPADRAVAAGFRVLLDQAPR